MLVFTAGSFRTDDDDDSANTTHQQVISAALPFLVIAVTCAVFLSEASGCVYLHHQSSRTKDLLHRLHLERRESLDSDFSGDEEDEQEQDELLGFTNVGLPELRKEMGPSTTDHHQGTGEGIGASI